MIYPRELKYQCPIPHRATTLQALKFYMLFKSPAVNNEIDLSKMNESMWEDRHGGFLNSLKHIELPRIKYKQMYAHTYFTEMFSINTHYCLRQFVFIFGRKYKWLLNFKALACQTKQ